MESQSEKAVKSPFSIVGLLSHPLTGFAVGIIGIILAIYFYFAGDKAPKLMFLIHPIRTPIVQIGRLSNLSVSLRGKPINGDLTAAQFIVWNAGKAPVRHDDILKPLILATTSNCPIYEATIRNISRDVTGFQLITNDIASGRLGFDWKILEHNDGASIQVLYGGDQKLSFKEGGGVVVGQSHIPFQVLNVNSGSMFKQVAAGALFLTLMVVLAVSLKDSIKNVRKAVHEGKLKGIFEAWMSIIFFLTLEWIFGFCLFSVFVSNNAPPFNF
jgi:hypothetical protein